MKIIELKDETSAIDAVNGLQRGANYLQILDNDQLVSFVEDRINTLNESFGGKKLIFKKFQDEFELEFNGLTLADEIYLVASSVNEIPLLKEQSYLLKDIMNKVKATKKRAELDIDESLEKYAKALAFRADVKYLKSKLGIAITGDNSGLPISKQIEEAYRNGDRKISFDLLDVSLSTIRCYASNLSLTCGEKIRCSAVNGYAVVYLKEESQKEKLFSKIQALLSELDFDNDRIALLDELKSFYE